MGSWQPCVCKSWVLRQQVFWGVQPGGGWEPRIWVFSWEVAKLQRLQLNTTCSAEPLPLSTPCPIWTPHRHLTPKLRPACPGDIPNRSQSTYRGQKRSGAHPLLPWEHQTCSGTQCSHLITGLQDIPWKSLTTSTGVRLLTSSLWVHTCANVHTHRQTRA